MEKLVNQVLGDLAASKAFHWNASTLAQHEATLKFYSEAEEVLDSLVETYQGRYGKKLVNYNVMVAVNQDMNVLKYFNASKTAIEDMRFTEIDETESVLQNIVDELIANYDLLIYKLQFLS